MKLYELSYLASSTMPEEDIRSLQEKLNNLIVEMQGTINRIDDTQKRGSNLLSTVTFYMAPEKISELSVKLRPENKIINFIVVNKKPQKISTPLRRRPVQEDAEAPSQISEKPKKVEIKEIEKKLDEILGE